VIDRFYQQNAYRLLSLAYAKAPPLRARFGPTPRLAPNPGPEIDLARPVRSDIVFRGGMGPSAMGRGGMGPGMMGGGMSWTLNGVVGDEHHLHQPFVTLERGRTCVIALSNETDWHHPIHLHGHFFRVIARDGRPTRFREWRDTALLAPHERAEIAFVAHNPGDWMLHCHVLDHQAAGMMATLRVA